MDDADDADGDVGGDGGADADGGDGRMNWANLPESVRDGWHRDAEEYGPAAAAELLAAENPELVAEEPPDEVFEQWAAEEGADC